jgi:hypothetical protein
MAIAEGGERAAQPIRRIAAAVFRDDDDIGVVAGQRLGDRRKPGAAALPDIPGEEAQLSYSPRSLLATARPLTSAPASGDIRRKNGTDSSDMNATEASANEKSAGPGTVV